MNIIKHIDWAADTIRNKEHFGLPELQAANSREKRAKGALMSAKKHIQKLHGFINAINDNENWDLACDDCLHQDNCSAKLTANCTDILMDEMYKFINKEDG